MCRCGEGIGEDANVWEIPLRSVLHLSCSYDLIPEGNLIRREGVFVFAKHRSQKGERPFDVTPILIPVSGEELFVSADRTGAYNPYYPIAHFKAAVFFFFRTGLVYESR